MDLPDAKRAKREPRLDAVAAMLKWLTAAGATGLDTIKVHATPDGGVGVASGDAGVAPGEEIASIPATCVMSVGRSAASAVGVACNALPHDTLLPVPEYVLWLDMASGRRDESHASHPYLAALPKEAPDVASWTTEELALLAGTDVGAAAMASNEALAAEHARVQALLGPAYEVPLAEMRWARGCYLSRRFPPRLLDAKAPSMAVHKSNCRGASKDLVYPTHWLIAHRSTGAPGVLLPFFDLLNHGKGTEIEWRGDGKSVAFAAGADGIEAQAEIFNNYGSKANDELLLAHGFALENNEHDRVALKMTVASGDGRRTLGPFYLRRGGDFPRALWRALADPTGDPVSSDSDSPPEIDAEAVEVLLATLERKLAPFTASKTADAEAARGVVGRPASVAFYRIGQRKILEDAVEALRSMLG
jgi:hypothetical protein